jgi:alpha-tubulin suppressor-like RCC1 family protein
MKSVFLTAIAFMGMMLFCGYVSNNANAGDAQVSGGGYHTIGLKDDGTVVAVGLNDDGQCDVTSWTDIKQVSAAYWHTIGLRTDGTVVAVGQNDDGQCDVTSWTDIKQVAAGGEGSRTVGVKIDGTVVAVGFNGNDQADVSSWTDIRQVSVGNSHTIGLKNDGTVVAAGQNYDDQCDVTSWTDIKQVAAGVWHTIGLKTDGTVVAVGQNYDGQCDVTSWTDIKQVSAGFLHTIGLKNDGTVVVVGSNVDGQCDVTSWTDIKQVSAGVWHTTGVKTDGTAVAVGWNDDGQCDISSWSLADDQPVLTWYLDSDGDGYGDPDVSTDLASQPAGYVSDNTDCDDTDPAISPGASEIAGDGIDQDCDGKDTLLSKKWYLDSDGDGYGDPAVLKNLASQPAGYVSNNTDCDDTDPAISPGASEIAGDGIDQDCDGKDTSLSTKWYLDSDGDGYGDPAVSTDMVSQPAGYVSGNTDCDDTDPAISPGASEIAGDGIDQNCDGNDQISSVEQINLLSPTDNKTLSYGTTTGQVSFSFSKISGAAKYILHLELNDILNNTIFPLFVDLLTPGTGNVTAFATPGFSESLTGMLYNLSLDQATWDAMALYRIKWGVEAYDDSGVLVGSTYESSVAVKYGNEIKLLASSAITMTNPATGQEFSKSVSSPTFQWNTHQGVSTYTFILAHLGSLGFDAIINKPGLTLNTFPMDDPTWQSMTTGTWYWTVLGYDSLGSQMLPDFTIFDFEVKD